MRVRRSSDYFDLQRHRCTPVPCGLLLPADLTIDDWAAVGRALGRQEHALQWRIGDWWNHPGHSYGDRRDIVEAEDWDGPAFSTCANAGSVCTKFETSRRREVLTFSHHAEVANSALPDSLVEELLDWAEASIPTIGKPRSVRALREEVNSRLRAPPSFSAVEASKTETVPLTIVTAGEVDDEPPPPRELRVHDPIDMVQAGIRDALEATKRLSPALEQSAIEPVLKQAKQLVAILTQSLRVARGEASADPDGKVVKLRS